MQLLLTIDFFFLFFYNTTVSNETKEGEFMDQVLAGTQLTNLLTCPLFQNCPAEMVHKALADPECTTHSFDTGQTLYQPHSFARCLGVILSGSVRVTRDSLAISALSPGDLFGAAALFNDREDYVTTLTACTPCHVVLLTQELVSRLMDESPCIRDNYIRYLSGRIRFLSSKIRALAADSVEGRLAQYLLTNLTLENTRLDCPATELAKRLGISRASLYRAFEALESQGLIRREGRAILVPDLKALDSSAI